MSSSDGETIAVRVTVDVLVPRDRVLVRSEEVVAGIVANDVYRDAVRPRLHEGTLADASLAWEVVRTVAQEAPPASSDTGRAPVAGEVAPVASTGLPSELALALTALEAFERFKAESVLGPTGQLSLRSIRNAIVAVGEATAALTEYVADGVPSPATDAEVGHDSLELRESAGEYMHGFVDRMTDMQSMWSGREPSEMFRALQELGNAVSCLVDMHRDGGE